MEVPEQYFFQHVALFTQTKKDLLACKWLYNKEIDHQQFI
jgi:hypothetical protein